MKKAALLGTLFIGLVTSGVILISNKINKSKNKIIATIELTQEEEKVLTKVFKKYSYNNDIKDYSGIIN